MCVCCILLELCLDEVVNAVKECLKKLYDLGLQWLRPKFMNIQAEYDISDQAYREKSRSEGP